MITSRQNLLSILSFMFLIFYLPIILILVNIIPFSFRFELLIIITIVLIIYSVYNKYTLHSLGFRKETLKKSLIVNLLISSLFILLMLLLYYLNLIRKPTIPKWNLFFAFYICISSPSQEFLYRGFLFAFFERNNINSHIKKIVFSTITYAFLHIIYMDLITVIVALMIGAIWGLIYSKFPNIIGVALSHAILGVVSILVGII